MPKQKQKPDVKPAIDLCGLIERFGSEEKCRTYLEALRWHEGVVCPRCDGQTVSHIAKRHQYDCDKCRYQFSVTAGTIFNDTHLPLWKWFIATYLICESRKGMSANQVKRTLGISYKTAWYLCHRIRAAMKDACPAPMTGTVEMDETYIGGKVHHGGRSWHKRYANKEVVIGIRQRGGDLRFFHADDAKTGTLAKYIRENISGDVDVVVTDELPAYHKALGELDAKHETVCHSAEEYVRGDVYTNSIESAFSLLKRGIVGTWHKLSAKHLEAYLDEMTFRFNNRDNAFLFRDTLIRLLNAEKMEYKELTAAA